MELTLNKILDNISFSKIYIDLCNHYDNIDNGINFLKNDVVSILKNYKIKLKYSSREKLFYQDYLFEDINCRFILPYKYGFIDCSYTIYNELFRWGGRFGELSGMIDKDFERKVSYKFPIATSVDDLEIILSIILKLHNDFITEFERIINDKTPCSAQRPSLRRVKSKRPRLPQRKIL